MKNDKSINVIYIFIELIILEVLVCGVCIIAMKSIVLIFFDLSIGSIFMAQICQK